MEPYQFLELHMPLEQGLCVISVSCSVVSDSSDPMVCSLPVSSVHGTLQAIMLELVAIPFSKGSSQPRDQTRFSV